MFGAIASLIGAMVTASAQSQAIASQERQANKELKFQEEQADRQEKLQTAARTDAMGNRLEYDERTGFEAILAPLIQSMVDATNEEQYKSIALDAPRNRAARERQDDRTKLADSAFEDAFAQFSNRAPVDEGRAIADATKQAVLAFGDGGGSNNDAGIQAIRSGVRAPEPGGGDNRAGQLAATLMSAKQGAKAQSLAEENAANAVDLSGLSQIMAMANQAPQANIQYSNAGAEQSARADSALSSLINIIANNAQVIGGSMDNLTEIAGKTPDFGQIFGMLTQGAGGLDKWLQQQSQQSSAQQQQQSAQTFAQQQAAQKYGLDAMKVYGGFQDHMTPEDFMSTLSIF